MSESLSIYSVACPISSSTRKSVVTSKINREIQDLDKKIFFDCGFSFKSDFRIFCLRNYEQNCKNSTVLNNLIKNHEMLQMFDRSVNGTMVLYKYY